MTTKNLVISFIISTSLMMMSCKKEANSIFNKTIIPAETKTINSLSTEKPSLLIYSQNTHDSLLSIANKAFGIIPPAKSSPSKTLSTSVGTPIPPQSVQPHVRQEACDHAYYIASGISSGGMFSSFITGYSNNAGVVSNFSLSLSGFAVGWSWESGTTIISGLHGTTYGTAKYGYGIGSYSFNYALDWELNPTNCIMYYSWRQI